MGEGKLKTKLCTEGVIDLSQEEREKAGQVDSEEKAYNPLHDNK
jgi:hypothetical protein